MSDKYLMLDMDDEKTNQIAEIMSNKTCKAILLLLAEKEMSEGDIAGALKMPLNTVGYNVKKLTESGLIEKSKAFFWSAKGRKIPTYKISNKKIVISPKPGFKGIVPAILISGLAALGIRYYYAANAAQKSLQTQDYY